MRTRLPILMIVVSALLALTAVPIRAALSGFQTQEPPFPIDPDLILKFQSSGINGYMIHFQDQADLSVAYLLDWDTRGAFVMRALQDTADRSQARVRAYLDSVGVQYHAFWIDNIIVVEGSDFNTFQGLFSFQEIRSIRSLPVLTLVEPVQKDEVVLSTFAVEPNLVHVRAPDVWGLGYTGSGVVVANIDTGVRYSHLALEARYRGRLGGGSYDHNYNWWDPYGTYTTAPADANGHGTHTMGTVVGDDGGSNQIGISPGAQWIACRGCSTSSCGSAELLSCAQFMVAPWDLSGSNPDPGRRPHVVNNSWGDCAQSYDPWYRGVVDSWIGAGIYPVFSNGNNTNCGYLAPPGLNTVGNPARYGNVTGVGSTGQSDGQYASHSNWGPTDDPDLVNPAGYPNLKPQVVAPGVNIRSSMNSGDSAYAGFTGTSMSAPHVSGLVALMWQAAPCLVGDYATTESLIQGTAISVPYASGNGDEGPGNVPNHATGWGEIDALAAVQAAAATCQPDFTLSASPDSLGVCIPDDAIYSVDVGQLQGYSDPVTLSSLGQPAGSLATFSPNPVIPPGTSVLTITNTGSASPGTYPLEVIGVAPTSTHTTTVGLSLYDMSPGIPVLTSPSNGASNQPTRPTFAWVPPIQAGTYQIDVATDSAFASIVDQASGLTDASYTPAADLANNTLYYWRVRSDNACSLGPISAVYSFTTEAAPGECSIGTLPQNLFQTDFEAGGAGWTHGGSGDTWSLSGARTNSGNFSYHAVDVTSPSEQYLQSPAIVLPTGESPLTLQFWNWQEIEDRASGCFDGGLLEISVDGGPWTPVTTGLITDPYDGLISSSFGNPRGGDQAWCGDPQDWIKSVVELDAYAGSTVEFRFILATDSSVGREGWYLDDVFVQSCVPSPEGALAVWPEQIDETVAVNDVVTTTLSISNTGSADLNWTIGEESTSMAGGSSTRSAPPGGGALAGQATVGTVCSPADLSWVSVSPSAGITGSGMNTPVDVVLDTAGLTTGTYTGTLCIESDSSLTPQARVPLTMTVANDADLELTLSDTPDPVDVSSPLTYTLIVTNTGTWDATGVVLTDTLPSEVVIDSVTPSSGTCFQASGQLICDLGDLLKDTGKLVTIVAIAPSAPGAIINTAQVTSNEYDADPTDNSATALTRVGRITYLPLIPQD